MAKRRHLAAEWLELVLLSALTEPTMKRRQFLKSASAATISLPLFLQSSHAKEQPGVKEYFDTIGLQVWTVRNQLEKDIPGTLKAIADAGYHQIELGRVLEADKYIPIANDLGMKVTSSFIDWQAIGNPTADGAADMDKIIEKGKELGLKHIVFGYIGKGHRETADHYKAHAERANKAGEKCKQAGMQLCYHNHSFEFTDLGDGKTGWDLLVEHFDDELVKFEVDVFWVKVGGRNPIKTMRELKGRISQVHLKDMKKGTGTILDEGKVPNDAFQELGDGVINMQKVMQVAYKMGAEQCHVEQDQSPDPIKSIAQSYGHLQELKGA